MKTHQFDKLCAIDRFFTLRSSYINMENVWRIDLVIELHLNVDLACQIEA